MAKGCAGQKAAFLQPRPAALLPKNHKFNSRWHTATETWYMYQRDVPSVTPGLANLLRTEPNANGALCAPGQLKCLAPEWAAVKLSAARVLEEELNLHAQRRLGRCQGQRTGVKTKYSALSIMWGHWIGTTVLFRPELRFEHSYDLPAYDNGAKSSQFTVAVDAIFQF